MPDRVPRLKGRKNLSRFFLFSNIWRCWLWIATGYDYSWAMRLTVYADFLDSVRVH
jgi:hypothetical protein